MIKESTFYGCTSLTQITLPSSLEIIDSFAFYQYSSLKQIVIPSSVTSIGIRAFYECSSLSQIEIPSSLTNFEPNTFYGCNFLNKNSIPRPSFDIPPSATIDDFEQFTNINDHTFTAIEKKTGKKVCITKIRVSQLDDLFSFFEKTCVNVKGLLKINNFYIKTDEYNPKYFISTDYMRNENVQINMKAYLDSKGTISNTMNPTIRSKIIFGVASIMKRFHRKNIPHSKLTNINVFLDDNFEPVIGLPSYKFTFNEYNDVDVVRPFDADRMIFLAPELISGDENFLASDVYSYGIFLYYMFSTKAEFRKRGVQILFEIARGIKPKINPEIIPDCYRELIEA